MLKINVLNYFKPIILLVVGGCLSTFACAQNQSADTPEDFIARFKNVAESGDAQRFQSEILVSKTEFREFMKDNSGIHFDYENPGPNMDAKLDKMVEETWPFTLKNALVQFQENEYEVYFEKFKLDSIQTDGSPLAIGTALGRVPFVKELVISAHFQQLENPAIRHIVRFPCLKVYDGKWKLWSRIETTKTD